MLGSIRCLRTSVRGIREILGRLFQGTAEFGWCQEGLGLKKRGDKDLAGWEGFK